MALEGTLQDFALVDILQLIGMQRKTGSLTLSRKDETITVLVQDGMVIWAAPADEQFEANLGRTLVARGLITRPRWEEARQIRSRRGQRLIPFLFEGQWISRRDLERVVERQALEALYRALRWRDGRYTFVAQEQVDMSRGQISPVGTETILLEAVRQMDEWPLIEKRLPSSDLVVQRSSRPLYHEKVPSEGLAVLELVDGQRTAREIAEVCDFGEFDAYKGIADLLGAGVLQLEQRAEAAQAAVRRRVRLPRRVPAWLFGVAGVAVTVVSLHYQVSLGHDPLYLQSSDSLPAHAAIQGRLLPRALDLYLLQRREYPQTLTTLQVEGLWSGELHDPWGRPWIYERRKSSYQLTSRGPDGRIGTADDLHISPSSRPD
ncbi:MAG: DUF4388 domain-containing protein [Candidatus Methylomirabilales bacterium]